MFINKNKNKSMIKDSRDKNSSIQEIRHIKHKKTNRSL